MANPVTRHIRIFVGESEDERVAFPSSEFLVAVFGGRLRCVIGLVTLFPIAIANGDATVGLAKGHHVSGQGEIVMILVGKPSQKVGCADGLSLSIFQNVFVQTIDAHDADVINQPLLDPFLPHRQATSTTAGCFIKLQQLEVGRSSSPDLRSLVALTSLSSEARSPYPFKFKVAPFPYRSSG